MRAAVAFVLLVASAGVAEASPSAAEASPSYDLIDPLECLGGPGFQKTSTLEWRVQLAVFDDYDKAVAFEQELTDRGLSAERWTAGWLDAEFEPQVIVSRAYPSKRAAERAARRYRKIVGAVIVRRYTVWHD